MKIDSMSAKSKNAWGFGFKHVSTPKGFYIEITFIKRIYIFYFNS